MYHVQMPCVWCWTGNKSIINKFSLGTKIPRNLGLIQRIFFLHIALKRQSKKKYRKKQTRRRAEHVSNRKLKIN